MPGHVMMPSHQGRAALQAGSFLGNRHEFFRPGVYRGARQSLSPAVARAAAAVAAERRRRLRRRLGRPRLPRGICVLTVLVPGLVVLLWISVQ